jgi:small multidrug resistance family-3 protein
MIATRALLFIVTALAEILGCFLPYLWLRRGGSPWLLVPAVAALALFAWLLTLHPSGAGRTYAAYGGVYIATSVLWLWLVEGQVPTHSDLIGAALCLVGTSVMVYGAR